MRGSRVFGPVTDADYVEVVEAPEPLELPAPEATCIMQVAEPEPEVASLVWAPIVPRRPRADLLSIIAAVACGVGAIFLGLVSFEALVFEQSWQGGCWTLAGALFFVIVGVQTIRVSKRR